MLAVPLGVPAQTDAPAYAGAAACGKCHAEIQKKWAGARHSKMVQPATATSVQGDFSGRQVVLRNEPYLLTNRAGKFYITESYLTGKPQLHRVDYTLGNRRIQHYLTTLPDGRIIVLPPSWDIARKQWFHNFDIGDPDESGEVEVQLWNKNCYSCHVSREEKNFDVERLEYKTAWQDFGINCERCHGPSARHVANRTARKPHSPDTVVQTKLAPDRNTMVCAQCHSFRDIFINGYKAGDNYYDYFVPILEYDQPVDKDPAYWPDGRTRRFSNDALGFWQSRCYLQGKATCLNCHADAHDTGIEKNQQLRPGASAICTGCHAGKATAAHTHHADKSAGSSCVECHMPRTVLSVKAEIRDHSITVPVPENTSRHAIPNACNNCHKDQTAEWAVQAMDKWWGPAGEGSSRWRAVRRADTFAGARKGDRSTVEPLLALVADSGEPPLLRANALGYLAQFSTDRRVFQMFRWALGESEPVLRTVAALRINPVQADRRAAVSELARALGDEAATVRLGAAVALTGLGIRSLSGKDGELLASARSLYDSRAKLNTDDAAQQFAAGRFFQLSGDDAKAAPALEGSLKLNPDSTTRYLLAAVIARLGRVEEARKLLEEIRLGDPQYQRAQAMLKSLQGR